MKELSLDNTAILIDFDGTITKRDTNDLLVEKQLNTQIKNVIKKKSGSNFIDFFGSLFNEIKITEEEYLEFILNEIELTRGFIGFYKNVKSCNIPIAVVSGGFENGIKPFFNKHGIEDVDILANRLIFDGNDVKIDFYHNIADCCDIGYCGNCKVLHYERYKKENDKVIFIGDGITDRAVANKADIVFAKDGLLEYCKDHNIDCIPWEDFDEISNFIFHKT